jgi:uncharacterized protein YggE
MMKRLLAAALAAIVPVAANAQAGPPPRPVAGITVLGHGAATMPVRDLAFVAIVRGNVDDADVVAMLRGAGVEHPTAGIETAQFNANTPTVVRGVVHDVSAARLEQLAKTAGAFVRAHSGATIDSIRFVPQLSGCDAVEESARVVALAQARRRAAALAAASGAGLGAVVRVSEAGGCPSSDENRAPYLASPDWFAMATLTATVSLYETVTFAITPGQRGSR